MSSNNSALVLASTVDSLIGRFRSHVHGRTLPAPAYVQLQVITGEVIVQPLHEHDLGSALGTLLLWVHTLHEVTASWWHTASGNLHSTVRGRTTTGLRITVYAAGPFDQCNGLVNLAEDESEGVSLDELYALACLLRDQAGEVA